MFGLFKKKVSAELRALIHRKADEALSHIPGQIRGTRYHTSAGIIDVSVEQERVRIRDAFISQWDRLPRNRERWAQQLQEFLAEANQPSATKYNVAATLLISGLLITDKLCEAGLKYPDDRPVNGLIFDLVARISAAFNFILEGPDEKPVSERPSLS